MADAANETTIDEHETGFTRRATLTGMGLVSEGIGTLKVAAGEVIDVTSTASFQTLDAFDRLAEDFGGPLADLMKLPTTVARATIDAGTTGTRRVLDAA